MALCPADRFKQGPTPGLRFKLLLVIVDDSLTSQARIVERAFNQSAIVLMPRTLGDWQPLFAAHAGRAQKYHAINFFGMLTGIFNRYLPAQAAGDQMIRRRLDELVEILSQPVFQETHRNRLSAGELLLQHGPVI